MLDVHDNAMVGSVPSAVWTLSALEYLDWSGNAVNSNFPGGATSLNLTYVQTASVPRLACSDCGVVSAIVTGGCRWRTRH